MGKEKVTGIGVHPKCSFFKKTPQLVLFKKKKKKLSLLAQRGVDDLMCFVGHLETTPVLNCRTRDPRRCTALAHRPHDVKEGVGQKSDIFLLPFAFCHYSPNQTCAFNSHPPGFAPSSFFRLLSFFMGYSKQPDPALAHG